MVGLISTIQVTIQQSRMLGTEKYNAHITILPNLDLSMISWAEERRVFRTVGLNIWILLRLTCGRTMSLC